MEKKNTFSGKKRIYATVILGVLLTNCFMALAGVVADHKTFGSFNLFGLKNRNSTKVGLARFGSHQDDLSLSYLRNLLSKSYQSNLPLNGYSAFGPLGYHSVGFKSKKNSSEGIDSSFGFGGPGGPIHDHVSGGGLPIPGFFFAGAPFIFNALINPYSAIAAGTFLATNNNDSSNDDGDTKELNQLVLLTENDNNNEGNPDDNTTDPTYRETNQNQTSETNAVPEPATLALMASAFGAMAASKKRFKK